MNELKLKIETVLDHLSEVAIPERSVELIRCHITKAMLYIEDQPNKARQWIRLAEVEFNRQGWGSFSSGWDVQFRYEST